MAAVDEDRNRSRQEAGAMRAPMLEKDPVVQPFTGSPEDLIRAAHLIFMNCGIQMSPQKVTRLVRQFKSRVERNGYAFFDFLANSVCLDAETRRRALADPDIARVIAYADPTGEIAVAHVMRRSHR